MASEKRLTAVKSKHSIFYCAHWVLMGQFPSFYVVFLTADAAWFSITLQLSLGMTYSVLVENSLLLLTDGWAVKRSFPLLKQRTRLAFLALRGLAACRALNRHYALGVVRAHYLIAFPVCRQDAHYWSVQTDIFFLYFILTFLSHECKLELSGGRGEALAKWTLTCWDAGGLVADPLVHAHLVLLKVERLNVALRV